MDAERILSVLNRHEVRHVVIGALGATLLGSPLRTDDVDICPSKDEANLNRLAAALEELGAKEWEPHRDEFLEREWTGDLLTTDTVWLLATHHGELDLMFEPAGTQGYKDLARDAVTVKVDELEVRVASLADIIRSKEAAGRQRDREQLPTLRRLLEKLQEE